MAAKVPHVPGIRGRKPVKQPVAKKTTMSFLRVEFIDGILKPIMKIDLAFQSLWLKLFSVRHQILPSLAACQVSFMSNFRLSY
jgi:hypothetical protein